MRQATLVQATAWLSMTSSVPRQGSRLRISAAHAEWNHVGIALVAMHEGFFAAEGLPELELVSFPEGATALTDREEIQLDLLAQGAVDIAIDPGTKFILEARQAGKPVCIVAARRTTHAFTVIGQKGLRSVEDLRGMTLDLGNRGAAPEVMFREYLKDVGIEPDRDVTIVYSGGGMHDRAAHREAFFSGQPILMVATREEAAKFAADGYPVLVDLGAVYPSRHDRVTAANEHFVRDHPAALKAFLKGLIRACNFVLEPSNRSPFEQIIRESGFLAAQHERQNYEGLYPAWHARVSRDLALPREGIERIVREEQRAGQLGPSFLVDDVLQLDALRQAQQALGLLE
jgi:ABC-type nitrate/sulfonate/bicarbonate transport system substrate-binding protein